MRAPTPDPHTAFVVRGVEVVRTTHVSRIFAMRTSIVIVCGVLAALLVLQQAGAQKVCPQCTCPTVYEPVCAFNTVSMRYRGFSSRCELGCQNKCKNNRFRFHSMGRCGKDKIQQKPPAPADV